MGSQVPRRRISRKTSVETLEDRQMFSADPLGGMLDGGIEHHAFEEMPVEQHSEPLLEQHGQEAPAMELHDELSLIHDNERTADFWIDPNLETDLGALFGDIEQTLSSANNLVGTTLARATYGFTGIGQTVAVIDSGIAWDHAALGGGLGANYRVVGGWDFTENDANPYDDGAEGSHGTHVSGIIGASASTSADSGVAPGVDLVGLRVFNDAGDGFFSWVESALTWVHTNRNSFENPITAINLSLGTAWNSASAPSWAMLEEEFALLEADGIFISVSAGNSFATYNAKGLSYPAASSHVVPVMSVDDSGNMSSFSQRHERAIAAPGRSIRSTVPDYAGNHNGVTDDWASMSGTSMAAPYVAGASTIVRQAMQFVGRTGIDQWDIYDHMMATADSFFDSATNTTFKRLDVKAAIDALMPVDEFGSTSGTAHSLGVIVADESIAGLIGTLTDKDFFTFTAGATGEMSLSATGTHTLSPKLTVTGSTATLANGTWTFDVVAGQSYTVSVETAAGYGIGYYDVDLSIEAAADPVTTVKSIVHNGATYSLDSEGWLCHNGNRVWQGTYDFAFSPADGTLYWLSTTGRFQHRLASGQWQDLDFDAIKFEITDAGKAYTLGADGWLCVNGERVWNNTKDFAIGSDQTLYWQGTTGLVQHRLQSGVWQDIDKNAVRFAVRDNGMLYSLGTDNVVDVNGSAVWQGTKDILLTKDQSLYWLSTYGLLQRLPNGGPWQNVDTNVAKFALRQDGVVYTLTADGRVRENGVEKWTNASDIRLDVNGCLVIDRVSLSDVRVSGRFVVSSGSSVGGASTLGAPTAGGGSVSSFVATTASTEADSQYLGDIAYDSFATSTERGAGRGIDRNNHRVTPSLPSPEAGVRVAVRENLVRRDDTDADSYWYHLGMVEQESGDSALALGIDFDCLMADAEPANVRIATDALFEQLGG